MWKVKAGLERAGEGIGEGVEWRALWWRRAQGLIQHSFCSVSEHHLPCCRFEAYCVECGGLINATQML